MIEPFRNEAPATNEWVAQDQGGIIPDKPISQRRRVAREDSEKDEKDNKPFLHGKMKLDRISSLRV